MNLLYRILQNFLIYFLPLVILLFSVSTNLPNSVIHKQTLQNTNFYNRFSTEFGKLNKQNSQNNSPSFWNLLDTANLDKPVELQKITEKNLDLTASWLLGNAENWDFYLPKTEPKTITKDIVEAKKDTIPDCEAANLEKIKTDISASKLDLGSIDLSKNFCLPKEVKSGQVSVESFLAQNNLENLASSSVSSATDGLKANVVNIAGQNTYGFFSFIRQYLTKIRTTAPYVIGIMTVVLLIITILSGTIGRRPLQDLQSNLWKIAISTLSLSAVLMLILGGIAFVNSWFGEFIFGQKSPEISNILTIQWLWFLFDLISIAILSAAGMIVVNLALMLLPKGNTQKRNQNLQKSPDSIRQNSSANLEGNDSNSKNSQNLPTDFYYPNSQTSNTQKSHSQKFSNTTNSDYNLQNNSQNNLESPENYQTKAQQNNSNLTANPYDFSNNSQSEETYDSKINNPDLQNSNQNNFQNSSQNNYTFDEQFQSETEQIQKPRPIRPNISGVILPHEQYEIPTQIPRNHPFPPKIHPKIHQMENPENPYSETKLEQSSQINSYNSIPKSQNLQNNSQNLPAKYASPTLKNLENPENPTNFVIIEDDFEAKN